MHNRIVDVHNIYNLVRGAGESGVQDLISAVTSNLEGENIAVGDFNLHHPSWGGKRVRIEEDAEELLTNMNILGMEQLVEEGTIIWQRGAQKSTIDLAFASPLLRNTLVRCDVSKELNVYSNHLPILSIFEMKAIAEPVVSK